MLGASSVLTRQAMSEDNKAASSSSIEQAYAAGRAVVEGWPWTPELDAEIYLAGASYVVMRTKESWSAQFLLRHDEPRVGTHWVGSVHRTADGRWEARWSGHNYKEGGASMREMSYYFDDLASAVRNAIGIDALGIRRYR